ncbi:NUDIX hydrolase [Paenibacillus amylolyticus]|uniref:NUDIX hydrolase n=1 Tax=Paenibacillus amylolyticus TaxID=1451 RepID=UPI003EC0712E
MMNKKEISAGGVVYRTGEEGQLQIQLIVDRYGKTTLAKGKMEEGETIEQTALREILEETGMVGRIVEPINIIAYTYQHAEFGPVDKEVHYYLVEAESGDLQPQIEEIKGVDWFAPEEAWSKQLQNGYDNNDDILRMGLNKLGINV